MLITLFPILLILITLELRYPRKRGDNRTRVPLNRGIRHLCILSLRLQENLCLLFYFFFFFFFLAKKKRVASKSSIFSHPKIIEFWFVYDSNLKRRYTRRPLSTCLEKGKLLKVVPLGSGQMTYLGEGFTLGDWR